jgi:hypothetical protein
MSSEYVIARQHGNYHEFPAVPDTYTVVYQIRVNVSDHATYAEARAAIKRLQAADTHADALIEAARHPSPSVTVLPLKDLPLFWRGRAKALRILDLHLVKSNDVTIETARIYEECATELLAAMTADEVKPESVTMPAPGARVITITELDNHPHEVPGLDFEPARDGDSYHDKF